MTNIFCDKYWLFLDDQRMPIDAYNYTHQSFFLLKENWIVVRNFDAFVRCIKEYGLPDFVSFDHDLADIRFREKFIDGKVYIEYSEVTSEKTGYDVAKWLVDYCLNEKQALPKYFVHSKNTVGSDNIKSLLDNFKIFQSKIE